MKVVVLFLLAFVVAASALAPLQAVPRGEYIQNEYIVVLQPGIAAEAKDAHIKELQSDFMLSRGENTIMRTFHIGDFVAYHAKLSQDMLARERAHPNVQYIDYNQIAKASQECTLQRGATWGLDRINEVGIQLDGKYAYGADGTGVDAYIIDTGILTSHKDFGGRAVWGTNTVDSQDVDCNGHGTHVAGTVGGTEWGVAKGVKLIAVKVLDCAGSGSYAGVIEGIKWTVEQGTSTRTASGRRSVANMSLGGGFSQAINDAVEAAVRAGIPFAVAAGNSNTDACNTSPASAPLALTVGATTVANKGDQRQEDLRASFSNYGDCLDIWAPGQLITSAWIGGDEEIDTISGTSMASPHVAGAAAVVLSANPDFDSDKVAEALGAASTKSVIDLACSNDSCHKSPNALLYSHCA